MASASGCRLSSRHPLKHRTIGYQAIEQSGKEARTKQKVKRVKPGYELREDLVKACKRIAFEEERHNYEIVEEALEQYLARRAVAAHHGVQPAGDGETSGDSAR